MLKFNFRREIEIMIGAICFQSAVNLITILTSGYFDFMMALTVLLMTLAHIIFVSDMTFKKLIIFAVNSFSMSALFYLSTTNLHIAAFICGVILILASCIILTNQLTE
ncbi:hypothetical protein [Pseudoalteromonas sp. Of7M-16]|uniref:hypothetical protein n=1 Tax=Pseudoalteromonas sp. Of7M-16 TaxID=2917756 RepID=UPI001EF6FD20|nr:hypothetical protein [Pseudoalteromonas sp. Of7M-16]MCG7550883.1 hypothetical protein [Pseudoalteromonas sp. Of7M-16]